MKRRKWKPEQKALIVLKGLKGRPIGELCADGVRGDVYAHELVRVRPGSASELLERAREGAAPVCAGAWAGMRSGRPVRITTVPAMKS